MSQSSDLYFHQIPVGEMANLTYLIGSASGVDETIEELKRSINSEENGGDEAKNSCHAGLDAHDPA